MEDPSNTSPSLSASDSKKWILRIALALLLGQAIWGLVASLTSNLIVPLTARVMGNDPNSPLYLGKGDIDIPPLFVSIVEFCLAGIVAVIMNSWVQKPLRTLRRKTASAGSLSLQAPAPVPSLAVAAPRTQAAPAAPVPVAAPPAKPVQAAPAPAPAAPPVAATAGAKPVAPPPPAKPEKPKPPKEVYYNIVGEPISMDDD